MKKTIAALVLVLVFAAFAWASYTELTHVAIVNSTVDSTPVGATTPSTGVFSALTDSALTTGCVGNAGGLLTANANCLNQINLSFHNQYLTSNQSITGDTPTVVDSYTLPALPSVCGTNLCRIRVSYGYVIFGGTGSGVCYVSDGTNYWSLSSANETNNNSTSCGAASLSPTQYSSGATPTISIYTANPGSTTVCTAANTSPCTSGLNAYLPTALKSGMQVEVILSN